ncbi:MAG: hypothetical protein PHY16_14510 [Methylobacter sp.]|nr:hypothetical protein [Methylobacter sp.]
MPDKRHGRRRPPIIDSTLLGKLPNTARYLRTGEASHLAQILASTPLSPRLQPA